MWQGHAARTTVRAGFLLVLAVVLAGGCRGRVRSTSAPVAETRVGVVDLRAVTRAHPRWQELNAVVQQVADVQAQLALLPAAPVMPEVDVQRALDLEARQLQGELDKELAFVKQDTERRLEAFADGLRTEQAAKIDQVRQDLEAQGGRAILAKRDELRAQLREAEQSIRDEYRYPLLNLRLRAEVAGLTSEEEAKQLQQQVQALQDERAQRIAAKADETQKAFTAFQKAKEDEINAKLLTAEQAAQAEAQQRLLVRQQELQEELRHTAAGMEETFRARLDRRRKELLAAAQGPVPGRQGTYTESLGERTRRLREELASLQEQRVRLEDGILAEVKIEVAAIAQDRRLDVVLTRFVSNVAGIDITTDVVEKLKR